MRSREVIEKNFAEFTGINCNFSDNYDIRNRDEIILEVLLDIRTLLRTDKEGNHNKNN